MGQFLEDDLNECLRPHVAPYLSQSDRRICCICSPERAVPACLASGPAPAEPLPGPAPAVPLPPVTPAVLLLINDCIAQNPRFQIQKYRK